MDRVEWSRVGSGHPLPTCSVSPFDCCILDSTLCSVLLHVLLHPVVHAHATVEPVVCGAGAAGRSNLTPSLSTWRLATLTPICDLLSFPFSKIALLHLPSPQVQEPRRSEPGKPPLNISPPPVFPQLLTPTQKCFVRILLVSHDVGRGKIRNLHQI